MLLQRSQALRKNQTKAENLMWMMLRARRLQGHKFKRQQVIGNYIVDFICFEKKLIVELDGGQHAVQQEYDRVREQWLISQGFRILRFWNNQVLRNLRPVLEVILQALEKSSEKDLMKYE